MIPKTTPERLSFFSDAIFAVLITALVLELRPPEHATPVDRDPVSLATASIVALKYPYVGLGICCCCLVGYLRPGAPGTN